VAPGVTGRPLETEPVDRHRPFPAVEIGREFCRRGGPKEPKPIKSLVKAFKKACTQTCYPGRIPYDLRRSAVRWFLREDISTHVAMLITGHKAESVFRRYDIVSEGDLRDAAAKLDAASG
jgi:integrase